MFRKILIANRGEIAVRIIRACREMGIASVAVFSEADRRALHVRLADEVVLIGPPPVEQSYLSIERILEAAWQSGAEAIHPGYGFLSENAAFARAVYQSGLVFIGPPAAAIEAMGDKGRAREQMEASGVPVVPGYQGQDDDHILAQKAQSLGYPVLAKAAAGGGGKGMRVIWKPVELDEALAAARREALHAFGDPRLILERYIPHARHIEFQVLADTYGHTLHLFERECSVQRRHQKIIEETPSPFLDSEMRARMGAAAVAAAQAAGYQNAGTIEFIVDPRRREFYFLEMNTRLQVEHPVTELVTGLDLVQWQIRIAAGEALSFSQADLSQRGHAIECRLYAEDPASNFLPATGPLLRFVEPRGPGVRVDSGFTSGDEITIHYDPLVAKLSVWAADRPLALRKMLAALRETVLLGITHNGQFLQDVLLTPEFQAGDVYTTWVEDRFGDWQPPQCTLPPEVLAAAALTQLQSGSANGTLPSNGQSSQGPDPYSPWHASTSFRLGG
ncbi:MAG: acetyl-CoA carboxylase biotin carboxylase subunit [Chloroflexi bacterium]|nr:MAG: acetyl-CoA carboxylase biotin carboxylase subunit [Chloroflexota bacterium]